MDSRVAVRFFRVSAAAEGRMDFPDVLAMMLAQQQGPLDRERAIQAGVTLRLERGQANGEVFEGEFCRVQRENIPPQASAEGLTPVLLGAGNGLGHVAAFTYHAPTRVIALQTNSLSANTNRISLYLAADDPARIFVFNPVLTDDAIERLQNGRPRSFTVRFAGLDRLDVLDADIPAAQGARLLAEAYDGVQVEIKISVGRSRRRWLDPRNLFPQIVRLAGSPAVEALKAQIEGESTPIDLLHEQLHQSRELDLPQDDPTANYEIRRRYLREQLHANMPLLERQFGDGWRR